MGKRCRKWNNWQLIYVESGTCRNNSASWFDQNYLHGRKLHFLLIALHRLWNRWKERWSQGGRKSLTSAHNAALHLLLRPTTCIIWGCICAESNEESQSTDQGNVTNWPIVHSMLPVIRKPLDNSSTATSHLIHLQHSAPDCLIPVISTWSDQ